MTHDPLTLAGLPETRIRVFYLALQNYHFAHRIWTFSDAEFLDQAFTDDILIGDQPPFKRLRAEEFSDRSDRKDVAEQIASTQFGLCFIAMFDILESIFGRVPDKVPDHLRDGALLIWAIRNAYSHKIGAPVWDVKDPNRRKALSVGRLSVDLGQLHGHPLDPEHIGGALCIERVWNELNDGLFKHFERQSRGSV